MDWYRENFKRASSLAEEVLAAKKNGIFDTVSSDGVVIDINSYAPVITKWYKMTGYRMKEDEEVTVRNNTRAVTAWLRGAQSTGSDCAYMLRNDNGVMSVLYGSGADLGGVFSASVPECEIAPVYVPERYYACSGIILGSSASDRLADLVAGSGLKNYYVALSVTAVPDSEVMDKIDENQRLIAYLNEFKSYQRVYGNATKRVEDVPVMNVVRAIAMLGEENEHLTENMGQGFVRSCIRFGAEDMDSYVRLMGIIKGALNYRGETGIGFEPVRCYRVNGRCQSVQEACAVPRVCAQVGEGYKEVYMLSWQEMTDAASFCIPPVNSYSGFYVKNYHIDENSLEVFPLTRPVSEEGVKLGRIENTQYGAVVPYWALLAHCFVSGTTNSGKTTTVKKILAEANCDKNIPFIVIEAAKKEYAALLEHVPGLKVYTPGTDGEKLQINPLEPEDGELIESQVDAVVRALVASCGGEHPIPEALQGLVKLTYEKCGWNYGEMAYRDKNRPFPTFYDVRANVDEYVAANARYGPEVKQNIVGALEIRSTQMSSGALGELFNSPFGLKAKDFLDTSCVIELSDFSEQSMAFLMNIVLFKLHSYLKRQPQSSRLKQLIVLEEAHNVFKEALSDDSSRSINNEYFEKLLAEIRSSGTGLIISDQRPNIMSEAVVANTTVKIVHKMISPQGKKTMGESLALTGLQTVKLQEFDAGECIVGIGGRHGVQHIRVKKLDEKGAMNPACVICNRRFNCIKDKINRMIEEFNPDKLRLHIAKIEANPYNSAALAQLVDNMMRDLGITAGDMTKCCFLGELLKRCSNSSEHQMRIIVNSYMKYLRR